MVFVVFAGFSEHAFKLALVVAESLFCLFDRDVTSADQRFGVDLSDAALGVDDVVHQRLGQRRIISLVVSAFAVADHVDDNVLVEPLSEVERQRGHSDTRLGVISVDVEDGRLNHSCNIRGVDRRAAGVWRGGKSTWLLTMRWIVPPVR